MSQHVRSPGEQLLGECVEEFAEDVCGAFSTGDAFVPVAGAYPRIEVDGVGPLAYPLCRQRLSELVRLSRAAPFGRGAETVVDERVRCTREIDARTSVHVDDAWRSTLQQLVYVVGRKLGVDVQRCGVEAHAYKLLVYERGGHFARHRDTEKEPGMFGTLIVQLPAEHEGGRVVVEHGGQRVEYAHGGAEASTRAFYYTAFFADCEHTIEEVTAGHRVCLTYNLVRTRTDAPLPAPCDADAHVARAAEAIRTWMRGRRGGGGGGRGAGAGAGAGADADAGAGEPAALVVRLEHHYTGTLVAGALKGRDAALFTVLKSALDAVQLEEEKERRHDEDDQQQEQREQQVERRAPMRRAGSVVDAYLVLTEWTGSAPYDGGIGGYDYRGGHESTEDASSSGSGTPNGFTPPDDMETIDSESIVRVVHAASGEAVASHGAAVLWGVAHDASVGLGCPVASHVTRVGFTGNEGNEGTYTFYGAYVLLASRLDAAVMAERSAAGSSMQLVRVFGSMSSGADEFTSEDIAAALAEASLRDAEQRVESLHTRLYGYPHYDRSGAKSIAACALSVATDSASLPRASRCALLARALQLLAAVDGLPEGKHEQCSLVAALRAADAASDGAVVQAVRNVVAAAAKSVDRIGVALAFVNELETGGVGQDVEPPWLHAIDVAALGSALATSKARAAALCALSGRGATELQHKMIACVAALPGVRERIAALPSADEVERAASVATASEADVVQPWIGEFAAAACESIVRTCTAERSDNVTSGLAAAVHAALALGGALAARSDAVASAGRVAACAARLQRCADELLDRAVAVSEGRTEVDGVLAALFDDELVRKHAARAAVQRALAAYDTQLQRVLAAPRPTETCRFTANLSERADVRAFLAGPEMQKAFACPRGIPEMHKLEKSVAQPGLQLEQRGRGSYANLIITKLRGGAEAKYVRDTAEATQRRARLSRLLVTRLAEQPPPVPAAAPAPVATSSADASAGVAVGASPSASAGTSTNDSASASASAKRSATPSAGSSSAPKRSAQVGHTIELD